MDNKPYYKLGDCQFLLLANLKNIIDFAADKSLKIILPNFNFINIKHIGKLQEKYNKQPYMFHLDSPVVNPFVYVIYYNMIIMMIHLI